MLSHVRHRSLPLVVVALLVLAGGCSSPSPSPATRATVEASSPALHSVVTSPPTTPRHLDPTLPPPGPPLPQPIVIPRDSYAPEPVVELGTMEIPALGLKHRMFQGVTLHNIDRGPSHWTGSALPGQMGNVVVAGHRATHSQPFLRIDALEPGDDVIFTIGGVRSTYRVTGHLVVKPADSWIANQTPRYTATLYACHPVGSTAERYVVRLEMVP
jgi:sortase A